MNRYAYNTQADYIRAMKAADFQSLGVPVVAYVKRVDLGGIPAYALHGADGTALGIEASEDRAAMAAISKNLFPVMVQ